MLDLTHELVELHSRHGLVPSYVLADMLEERGVDATSAVAVRKKRFLFFSAHLYFGRSSALRYRRVTYELCVASRFTAGGLAEDVAWSGFGTASGNGRLYDLSDCRRDGRGITASGGGSYSGNRQECAGEQDWFFRRGMACGFGDGDASAEWRRAGLDATDFGSERYL